MIAMVLVCSALWLLAGIVVGVVLGRVIQRAEWERPRTLCPDTVRYDNGELKEIWL